MAPLTRVVLLFGAAALLLACHPLWLLMLGRFLVLSDPVQPGDAIAVLGGGRQERVAYAVRLLNDGYAPWLIVTNSPIDVPGIRASYGELIRTEAIWQGAPAERIMVVPELVTSTVDEAEALRHFSEQQGFRRLLVVTEPYHTRRAGWILHEHFRDSGITPLVLAQADSWYQPDSWWQTREGPLVTLGEYLKLGSYAVGR